MQEGVVFAREAGGAVLGDPGGFDGERAAAAHGPDEGLGRIFRPFGGQHDAGGEGFAQGGHPPAPAVAAVGQRRAAGIQENPRVAVFPVERDAGGAFGRGGGIGPRAGRFHEAVGDGVLAAEHGEARIADGFVLGHAVHVEGHVAPQPVFPRQGAHRFVEVVGGIDLEAGDLEEHAVGGAQPEIEAHGVAQIAFEADGRGGDVLRGVAQPAQFGLQHVGAAAPAGGHDPGFFGPVHQTSPLRRPFAQNAGTRQRRK